MDMQAAPVAVMVVQAGYQEAAGSVARWAAAAEREVTVVMVMVVAMVVG